MSSARTRPRFLTVLVTVGLIAGFVLSAPAPTRVLAEPPVPTIEVTTSWAAGHDWPGPDVTLTLDDPANGTGTDHTSSPTVVDGGQWFIDFGQIPNFNPADFGTGAGWVAAATNGSESASITIPLLTIDAIDTATASDNIFGHSDPGLTFDVDTGDALGNFAGERVEDSAAAWSVNLPVADRMVTASWFDIAPYQGDRFTVIFQWPNLWYELDVDDDGLRQHTLFGLGWPAGASLNIGIDAPDNLYDRAFPLMTSAESGDFQIDLLAGYEIPLGAVGDGWEFTATTTIGDPPDDHVMGKTLHVQHLTIETVETVDLEAGTASGSCAVGGVELVAGIVRDSWPDGPAEEWFPECSADGVDVAGSEPHGTWQIDWEVEQGQLVIPSAHFREADWDNNTVIWGRGNGEEPRQIEVFPDFDQILAWWSDAGWWLTIERPGAATNPVFEGYEPRPAYGFDLWAHDPPFEVMRGDTVTMSDGPITSDDSITKVHTVVDITVNPLTPGATLATGTGPPNTNLFINLMRIPEDENSVLASREKTVLPGGTWTVDFGVPFGPGLAVEAVAIEPDPADGNDQTHVMQYIPAPTITASVDGSVWGEGWPAGEAVLLTIDDPTNGVGVDFTIDPSPISEQRSPWPGDTQFGTGLNDETNEIGWSLEPGHIVTATTAGHDGDDPPDFQKDLTVVDLNIVTVYPNTGLIEGHAPPDTDVNINANNEFEYAWRNVGSTAASDEDPGGDWVADVSVLEPGDEGDGIVTAQFQAGTNVSAQVFDDDGDATQRGWCFECEGPGGPSIAVHYDNPYPGEFYGRVATNDWPDGANLTLTVKRWNELPPPPQEPGWFVEYTETTPNMGEYTFVQGHDGTEPFFVERGDRVTVTDGTTAKVHDVNNLTLVDIEYDLDVVFGTTDATDREVCVDLWSEPGQPRLCTADFGLNGEWSVDFDADITPQSDLAAWQYDDDGDATTMNNSLLLEGPPVEPVVQAYITEEFIRGDGFGYPSTLQVDLYGTDSELVTVDHPDHTWEIPSEDGFFFIEMHETELHLEPGMEIVVFDGEITKRLVLVEARFDSFDPDSKVVSGYAPDLPIVEVRLHLFDENYDPMWNDEQQPIKLFPDPDHPDFVGDVWSYDIDNDDPGYHPETPAYQPTGLVEARVEVPDEDGDGTFASLMQFTVFPQNTIASNTFDGESEVGITILDDGNLITEDPNTGDPITAAVDERGEFGVATELIGPDGVNLDPGDEVWVTGVDTNVMKHHVVRKLEIEEVNYEGNYVRGTTDQPNAWVEVPTSVGPLRGQANDDGNWEATPIEDFIDLEEGMHIAAWTADPDMDRTFVEPVEHGDPVVLAIKTEGDQSSFVGGNWNPDTRVKIEVFDGAEYALGLGPWFEPVVTPHPEDPDGRVDHFFDEFPGFLEPGWTVRATGQESGRVVDIRVVDLIVDGWDGGRIYGTTNYEPTGFEPDVDPMGVIRVELFEPHHASRIAEFGEVETGLWSWEADFETEPGPGEEGEPFVFQEGIPFGQVGQESAIQGTGGTLVHIGGEHPREAAIEADPLNDVIRVYGFDDPETIGLELNGVSVDPTLEPSENLPGQDEEAILFDVYPIDLRADDVITIGTEGDPDYREHVVTPLTITARVGSIVYGMASPNAVVHVSAGQADAQGGNEGFRDVQADGEGAWFADFGFDVTHPSTGTRADEPDDDGDATVIYLGHGGAGIWVVYELDLVLATDWTGLGPVTVSVDGIDITVPVTRGPDPVSFGGFDFPEPLAWYGMAEMPVDLVPGQTVTATDGIIATEHIIRDLRVETADKDADTLSGTVDLFGVPSTLIGFLVDEVGGAGVAFEEPAPDGPWTLPLLDANAEEEQPYDLQHSDQIGIALVTDEVEGVEDGDFTVVLWDMKPHITSLDLPTEPVEIGTEVALHAEFTDVELPDSHTAEVRWGDGTIEYPTVSGFEVDASHAYTTPGIYTVALEVTDNFGQTDVVEHQYIVVFDPDGGFVTGGGWFDSPAGAYPDEPELTGRVNFGFNAKYKNNSIEPTGETNVQLDAGDLHFKSTSHDWLVVVGDLAIYQGKGEINGEAGYTFTVLVVDDGKNDTIRIQISDPSGQTVYDNSLGVGNGSLLDKGSIVVHK